AALVVDESLPLPDVRQRLKQQHIRRLPVVNSAGRLVGIVTEGDINRVSDSHITDVRDYSLYHRVADLPIGEIMTRTVVTVTPDTPILVVACLLLDHRISGVPVIEDGRVIGVQTGRDLLRVVLCELAGGRV